MSMEAKAYLFIFSATSGTPSSAFQWVNAGAKPKSDNDVVIGKTMYNTATWQNQIAKDNVKKATDEWMNIKIAYDDVTTTAATKRL